MALVKAQEILSDARKNKYAVPMFDVSNYEYVRYLAEIADDLKSPVLLAGIPPDIKGVALEYLYALMKIAAERVKVPVAIHLDHSGSFEDCKRCIDIGFNSVMIDKSASSFDENVAQTKEVVEYAKKFDVCVEAELGHVPDAIPGHGEAAMQGHEHKDVKDTLTKVEDVEKFVALTGVDALAVAIGTAHGTYISAPELDIERLKQINAISKATLVLHGGSGTPESELKAAIANGISKINIYTDLVTAYNKEMKANYAVMTNMGTWPLINQKKPIEAMQAKAAEYINMFGSANRA